MAITTPSKTKGISRSTPKVPVYRFRDVITDSVVSGKQLVITVGAVDAVILQIKQDEYSCALILAQEDIDSLCLSLQKAKAMVTTGRLPVV